MWELAATGPADLEDVAALLQQSFSGSPDDPLLDRSSLRWKYYEDGPEWQGSRSYALRRGKRLVAHAAVWPFQIRVNSGLRSGIAFCDWASDKRYPGVGVTLLKQLLAFTHLDLVTGGGAITRQILPRIGFQHWADRAIYSKIVRPLRQFRTRTRTVRWKELVRLGRNFAWSRKPASSTDGWTAEPAMPSPEVLTGFEKRKALVHTAAFLEYLLRCPIARFQFLLLRKNRELRGYSVTSEIGGQGRIADLRIDAEDNASWSGAVASILERFEKDPAIAEIMAFGSVPYLDYALKANGFQKRDSRPLVVFDPAKSLIESPVPQVGDARRRCRLRVRPDLPLSHLISFFTQPQQSFQASTRSRVRIM